MSAFDIRQIMQIPIAAMSLWTRSTSTTGHQVDLLFFALMGVCLCRAAGRLLARILLHSLSAATGETGNPPDPAVAPVGMVLDAYAIGDLHRHVYLGRKIYFLRSTLRTTPRRCMSWPSSGCGSSSIPKVSEKSIRCTSRSDRPVKLLLISEDVIHSFFVPAFRMHMDVLPRPLYIRLVPGHASRNAITCFARSIAARITRGMTGRSDRDAAGRLPALAETSTRKDRWRCRGGKSF